MQCFFESIGLLPFIVSQLTDTTPDEVLLYVLTKKDWLRNYQVRLALSQNPKTPMPRALRLLETLQERDLRNIQKSKNVRQVIASTAMRILMRRNKK